MEQNHHYNKGYETGKMIAKDETSRAAISNIQNGLRVSLDTALKTIGHELSTHEDDIQDGYQQAEYVDGIVTGYKISR